MSIALDNKRQNRRLINHLLQKATGLSAQECRELISNPDIQYKFRLIVLVKGDKLVIKKSEIKEKKEA